MDFKFSKDSGESHPQEAPGEKKNQRSLLVLLLILVGGLTYLYFFTGLFKTQEVQKTTEAPAPPPQIVKMPLPTRDGEPVKPEEKPKTEEPKTTTTAPVTAATPPVKPAAAPVKPTAAPVKPAPAPAAKPADKKPQPEPATVKKEVKTAATKAEEKKPAATKKPVVAEKKVSSGKDETKIPASSGQVKTETAAKTKKSASDSLSLVVGNYFLEEALSADMGRIRKAGFVPVVKPSTRKKTAMNRLFVAEFNDRESAQTTLEKLKRLTSDAFIIEQGGRFTVYAGSYLQNDSATSEKERLKAAGFSVIIKHSDIAIPSQSLSVGPFKSKKAADAALGKLKNAGLNAAFSQK
jgi:cell division septation protein DedD